MISPELIKGFFKEQFDEISPFFLYKDHQLLNDNKFQEFIDRQLSKSHNRFILGTVLSVFCLLLGFLYFWFYAQSSEILHLLTSFFWIIAAGTNLYWFSKQYFIIKSSMSLFQKMIAKSEVDSIINI